MSNRPGYFDLQVNGYGGVTFDDENLDVDQLRHVCTRMQNEGADGFLLTITTELLEPMAAKLRRVVELRRQDPLLERMIPGFHIEGPFISPVAGYHGAHPKDAVRPATPDAMQRLLEAANGLTRLVTLAPEYDEGFKTTRMLANMGVTVAAGHCDPTLDQLRGAIDAGLSMFTHLGNGCPMVMHRHDNIVQRALSLREHLWCCFIADGAHVAWPALENYLALTGVDRAVVVTDAISAAGMGPGRYKFGRWDLLVGEDSVARAPDGSHLVGAAITMPQTETNLREKLGLPQADLDKLLRINPRKAVGLPITTLTV